MRGQPSRRRKATDKLFLAVMEIKCKTIGVENCIPLIKVKWDSFAVEYKPLFNDNRIHLCRLGWIKPEDNDILMVCPTTLTRHPTV